MPETVERRQAWIWSNGQRLDADVYRPIAASGNALLPGVVLSHGWGGDKRSAERYAARFAEAGMISVCFTHSTWGHSSPRFVAVEGVTSEPGPSKLEISARIAREVVDPLDWAQSFRAATDFLVGEPNVDPLRLGAWGTSYGGSSAAYSAATDPRVSALAIQVAMVFDLPDELRALAEQRAVEIARGTCEPIPQTDRFGDAVGFPHYAHMARFDIQAKLQELAVPTLILDAENDELIDIEKSGAAAFRALQANGVTSHYEVFPDLDHYGIYFEGYERSAQLALDWFVEHLSVERLSS